MNTTNLPTAPSQQMALRISGTKQRQAGFVPLVSVGVLAGNEGANMDRATTVAEKPVYVIKHASDYILYQVIDRWVKSFDADAPGLLSIALTIPRQFQLSDGRSPYSLLTEVYEKFVSEFMRSNNDGRDCFLNTDIDSDVFRSILQNYSLEARKTGYVTMNPAGLTATLRLSKDKMVDFFRDSQYGELAQFKDVEIGEKCQSFPGLDNLEIPRPVKYVVYVNGTATGISLGRLTRSYSTQVKDTDCYVYENVSFTLDQLFAAPDGCIVTGNSKVQLDQARRRIDCMIGKREVMYNCVIKLSSPDNVADQIDDALKSQKIKILIDRTLDITSYGDYGHLQIPATQILPPKQFSLSTNNYEGYLLSLASPLYDKIQHKITLTITAKQQPVSGPLSTKGQNGYGMGNSSATSNGRNLNMNHRRGEIPPVDSEGERIAKEKERDKRKRERRKILLFVFAVGLLLGLLLGAGVGYVIGHNIVKNDRGTEEPVNPPVEDPQGSTGDIISENRETSEQREEMVNKRLRSLDVIAALREEYRGGVKSSDGLIQALANSSNEDDKAMSNDIPTFESSKEIVDSLLNKFKAEEDSIQLQKQHAREEAIAQEQKARQEILELVNKRDKVQNCRDHSGWNIYLTKGERGAIEAILDMSKYQGVQLKRVREYLEGREFSNYEEIKGAQEHIWIIIGNK